ncbi:MAG: Crp/Fnr family transcriptional regulator [Pedobacter sp.]|nr:Crp/Fnr family transcriptional regulator [Pedobacter sp.]MDQ8052390.1 Crp/Fnr family transcriptional regulator [Pedobacter sp.]
MDVKFFIDYLQSRVVLDQECVEAISARIKQLTIIKGSNLLYPGDLCKHLYFIKTGFFRVYTSDGFEDKTIDFATDNQFMTAIDSFFKQQVGHEGIVCEETAIVWRISYHDWLALQDLSPCFLHLSNKILQEHLIRVNHEKNIYRISNASQKYRYLGEQYPGIANVVSQKHIANYLGITGPTLSNLLKEMFRKQK